MKKTIELHGKKITFPCRMFKPKDIKEMGIAYVEESIYFNIAKPNQAFEAIESHIEKNMGIINYPDFSATSFSNELLLQSCQDQINSNSDFITLPKFKDETEHETIQKLELAREIKKLTDKPIILEIAYNTNLDSRILEDKKENFDYISIFYGVKYGHLSQYEKLITRIVEIKMLTNKRVFCNAVPMKYAGANINDVRFMPAYDIICDAWIKNWMRGGGESAELKLTDVDDLRDKTYSQWLETGHRGHDIIPIVSRTVYDLFHNGTKDDIDEYHRLLADETLSEIKRLKPSEVENYITKFHRSFWGYTIWAYAEKLILEMFRLNEAFSQFIAADKKKLEYYLREQTQPSKIFKRIDLMLNLVEKEKIRSVPIILERMKALEE